ncbi:endonuclease YncB(thermonuclease family) [Rhodobacter sp. JA431]|uniref:thermonuclease family protein n=1 Tax=Rhodobacter sp. JA431 TaxID=570013 RepID=UPI000BD45326|nr:thermonuclease family protein [Rhodobacter sp. JA431]SOC16876.1 endonuclease YncB(thermonuclease family) [Rhodobacter sp. JA431]
MPLRFQAVALIITLLSVPAFGGTLTGTASVIDGDTIEIHGTRIRLSAMDAIESRQRCTLPDGSQWNCGKDAAFALADKIGRAPVSCDVSGTDRYGRAIATCYLRGEDIGGWMVEHGWAVAYRRYGTQYVPAENRARVEGRGIWASQFVMPSEWRRGKR